MYIEEFILVDVVTLLYMDELHCTVLYTELELNSIGNAVVYIQSQQRNEKCENCS